MGRDENSFRKKQFNWSISGCLDDVWVIIDRLEVKRWRECWKLDQLPIYFHQQLNGPLH